MGHLQKISGSQELYKQNSANHITSYTIPVVAFKLPNSVKGWGKLLSKLNDTTIQWMFSWYPSENFVIRGKMLPYLVLIGIRRLQPYAPLGVMRQAGRMQVILQVDNMDHYRIDYDNDKIPFAKKILRMWRNKRDMVKDTIAPDRYQARYDTFYLEWLRANLEGSVTRGINMGGLIKDKAVEAEIKYR
uniref:DUF7745 domain-containing protein n=1 Tax=Nicotiana tabacum TaxID=4097 RepID=A0A1S4BUP2_TOBAC|nr:PREDICTED: uncharacterized protein LOC107812077 [Nicotiana tabacum]